MYKYYLNLLDYQNKPDFINKYLKSGSLKRLKKVGYFCGMDYASKDIYDFSEYISRFDHSLSVALLIYKLTKNKLYTLMALFHDIATPVFSHVIDYMNEDFETQESTEEFTEQIIKNDKYLVKCFKEDNIDINKIINFKECSLVDNNRPKLCADRLDGVILTGIGWTKNITKNDIFDIIKDIKIYSNSDNEKEIGFKSLSVAQKVLDISKSIDYMCHTSEDNYMMMLLAKITKLLINKNYLTYEDLYYYNEEEVFKLLDTIIDKEIKKLYRNFKTIKLDEIPDTKLTVKIRNLHPIVKGERIK